MTYLPANELNDLVDIILAEGLGGDDAVRAAFAMLPPEYVATQLPPDATPSGDRLRTAFSKLNVTGPFTNKTIGLSLILDYFIRSPISRIVEKAKQLHARIVVGGTDAPPLLGDALEDLRLMDARFFAARDELRKQLKELAQRTGPCALVINGISNGAGNAPDVGKSHTRYLLSNASQRSRAFDLAWVEIEKEQAANYTPDWLIDDLVSTLIANRGPLPDRSTMPTARWLGALATWALGQFATLGAGRSIWMVIDGVRHKDIHPDVRGLVARLAQRVGTPTGGQQLRLVLIDCDRTEILKAGCTAEEEAIDHLRVEDAEAVIQAVDPTAYASKWPPVRARLMATTSPLTSRIVSDAIYEVLS